MFVAYGDTISRLLKDTEIAAAIESGLISLKDPSVYLTDRRDDLIQPASMDVLLRDIDMNVISVTGISNLSFPNQKFHPDLDDSFLTFWPGVETETTVENLCGYDPKVLIGTPEMRSTMRRVGLDIGVLPLGLGSNILDEDRSFIYVRNPQRYPISVQRGLKIAQVLWADRGYEDDPESMGIRERSNKAGSGRRLFTGSEIGELVDSGDLYLSDLNSIGEGRINLHAGSVNNYGSLDHVVLSEDGVNGFEVRDTRTLRHDVYPGQFLDIETSERIGLGPRVAMRVYYDFRTAHGIGSPEDLLNDMGTINSAGGWIDPGYGYGSEDGAPFSVQRKAFSEPFRIHEGDLVGYGILWVFDEPVGKTYGADRGSHYNEARGFVGPDMK